MMNFSVIEVVVFNVLRVNFGVIIYSREEVNVFEEVVLI